MNDLMIDMETLSTRKNARIMSMAAVMFNAETGEIGQHLHIGIHQFGGDYGDVEQSTVEFWLREENAAALEQIRELRNANPYTLPRALETLNRFIDRHRPTAIWSNGASFDLCVLTSAYHYFDLQPAWKYWHERDCRTIVALCREMKSRDPRKETPFEGQPHNALNDAIHQARYVSRARQLLADKA